MSDIDHSDELRELWEEDTALGRAHVAFRSWLGDTYDTDALDAMLATLAAEQLDGDPVWLLIISGPGAAKTETVIACSGVGATVTSSIASEAALLSATPRRERAKTATGGLLRKLGDCGVLIIKDVTSILSMNRDTRAKVIAALREVHDGHWVREVGTDGGQTLIWRGRLAIIGAVTTAWDTAREVIATMGDRFVLIRIDSAGAGRLAAGRCAIGNTGAEKQMRRELAGAVGDVITAMDRDPITVTEPEIVALLAAADLVTRARTGVEYDYRGDVIDAHAPEMPTRFAKQLTQIVRGAAALGMSRADALALAIRCARDSMPPLRLAIMGDLYANPQSTPTDVRKRLDKPRATVDRQLKALHILGIVTLGEQEYMGDAGKFQTHWHYSLSKDVHPETLVPPPLPDLSPHTHSTQQRKGEENRSEAVLYPYTDISGNGRPAETSRFAPSGRQNPPDGCLANSDTDPLF
jgi:hypothetical protein